MAKRKGRHHKGGSKKAMRALRRGKHGVGRKGMKGLEHLFGRASKRSGHRSRKRK